MELTEGMTTIEQALMAQASMNRTPINGSLELLPLCNMNCDMCYVRLSREEMERQGRMRTGDEWIEIGRQMQKAGVLFLLLTGGEPFLHPEFRRIYLELRNMGMILTINTNGTMINEELARFLGENKPRRVNITLYGASEKAYEELCHFPEGFERTMNGIRLLRSYDVDVKIGGSLTKANQDEIESIIEIGEKLDVPVRIDTYMMPATRERSMPYNLQSRVSPERAADIRIQSLRREMGEELFAQYSRKTLEDIKSDEQQTGRRGMSCYAGKCSFTINWQGEMRPCVIMTEPRVSVFDVGFDAAWKYIIEETDKILLSEQCSTCRMRSLCRTCAASALLETGNYEGTPEYMCRYTQESLYLLQK